MHPIGEPWSQHLACSCEHLHFSFHFSCPSTLPSGNKGCIPPIPLHWFCSPEEDAKGEKTNSVSGRIPELLEGSGKCRAPGKDPDAEPGQQEGAGVDGGHTRGRFLINCLISFSFKRSDSYPCGVNRNFCNGFWAQD